MNFERKCSVMGRKMKFGCLVKKGVAEVRERDLPEVGPYDVLLHMKVCNICTTDYGQWLGLREHQGYPMAGGHEAAGISTHCLLAVMNTNSASNLMFDRKFHTNSFLFENTCRKTAGALILMFYSILQLL